MKSRKLSLRKEWCTFIHLRGRGKESSYGWPSAVSGASQVHSSVNSMDISCDIGN